jgi:hypothetical protein
MLPPGSHLLARISTAIALLLVATACGRLPAYALPKAQLVDAAQLAHSDGVPYRQLTRADFRATTPPIDNARHAARMSAFTCANVVPKGELQMEVRQPQPGGAFVARPKQIAFIAKMDRDCSWWNPKQDNDPPDYVLQHEQIHFAIAEAGARELTRRVRDLSATGDSPERAATSLQRAVDSVFRDAIEANTTRNTDFDRDTSGRHEPVLQQRWYEQLSAELKR